MLRLGIRKHGEVEIGAVGIDWNSFISDTHRVIKMCSREWAVLNKL